MISFPPLPLLGLPTLLSDVKVSHALLGGGLLGVLDLTRLDVGWYEHDDLDATISPAPMLAFRV